MAHPPTYRNKAEGLPALEAALAVGAPQADQCSAAASLGRLLPGIEVFQSTAPNPYLHHTILRRPLTASAVKASQGSLGLTEGGPAGRGDPQQPAPTIDGPLCARLLLSPGPDFPAVGL